MTISDLVNAIDADVPITTMKGIKCLGKVVNIHDGDTVKIVVKFDEEMYKFNCRMLGYDSPELKCGDDTCWKATNELARLTCDQSIENRSYCRKQWTELYNLNKKLVVVEFFGHDKYGRELVKLFDDKTGLCINDFLLETFAYNVSMPMH